MFKLNIFIKSFLKVRHFSKTSIIYCLTTVKIGNVVKVVKNPQYPELVPNKYLSENDNNKTVVKHLQWMLQKDNLGQDMFLVGPPGAYRRRLVMSFAELTKREIEYVSLSRDTTESDLKQRREIISGNAVYIDQTALRAATNGRILILDGIEKAERNVLPILNNLLENREMQLEDGRFLMRSEIYDRLVLKYSENELEKWKFVRCHENFRVVALGLPAKFKGNPLDPPLRSRFQSRFVNGGSYQEMVEIITRKFPKIELERVKRIVSFVHAIRNEDVTDLDVPFCAIDNVVASVGLAEKLPELVDQRLIEWIYPHQLLSNDAAKKTIVNLIKKFQLNSNRTSSKLEITNENGDVVRVKSSKTDLWSSKNSESGLVIPCSSSPSCLSSAVMTSNLEEIIAELAISHSVGDFCLIGPQGSGKSTMVEALSNRLGARVTQVVLYGDMTARDIVQQRETDNKSGDTIWRNSGLVRAAINGDWAVLDGLHRLEKGCMSVLGQLVTDRQLQLFDGSRLIRHDRYEAIKLAGAFSDADMTDKGIYCVHPNFRIIALAEPPSVPGESSKSSSTYQSEWLTPEVLAIFRFHVLSELSRDDEKQIVTKLIPNIPMVKLEKLLDVVHKLRTSEDSQIRDLSQNLSIRQILRISHRLTRFPTEPISNSIHKACLSKFLPKLVQDSLILSLEEVDNINNATNVQKSSDSEHLEQLIEKYRTSFHPTRDGSLLGEEEAKVPNIVFYDSVAHTRILLEMLQDFMIDSQSGDKNHLLLIGNQGVGKNKIVDRFLQLLNRSREYIQLHRDTTVQTLTLQPSIKDGRLVYEDSALVKAISKGRILVVDEADKASTQVTCILKTLVSSGEMELSDGRRILPYNRDVSHLSSQQQERIIRIHPDFRMIVLANRPGFPFLGNDFFGAMGDVFSCHAVDNPDITSEIKMLQKYGPSVPIDTIKKLVFLFTDLRDLSDKGQINYPYSTREIVNIVRHLEKYPNDALPTVLGNVFDFDVSNKEMLSTLETTLEKHGISLPGTQVKVILAKELPLPPPIDMGNWTISLSGNTNLATFFYNGAKRNLSELKQSKIKTETQITRSRAFSELNECISLRLGDYNVVSDMIASSGKDGYPNGFIHFVTLNPITLTTLKLSKDELGNCNKLSSCSHAGQLDLSDLFPPVQGSFRPYIRLSALPSPYENSVLLFESTTNKLFQIDAESGKIDRITCDDCLSETNIKLRPMWFNTKDDSKNQREITKIHNDWSDNLPEPVVVFHKPGDEYLRVFHVLANNWHTVTAGFPILTFNMIDKDQWLIQDFKNKLFLIVRSSFNNPKYTLHTIDKDNKQFITGRIFIDDVDASDLYINTNNKTNHSCVGLGIAKDSYVDIFPRLSVKDKSQSGKLYKILRPSPLSPLCNHTSTNAILPSSGIVVKSIGKSEVPDQFRNSASTNYTSTSGYLEVVNVKNRSIKYLQIPSVFVDPMSFQWLKTSIPDTFVTRLNNDIITLDNTGCIHKWTLCPDKLESELRAWKSGIGVGADNDRDLMIERLDGDVNTILSDPKHGKIDPTGAPHMGGNTWAGGSGGRDTAGLGGIGGPYRLDGGNDVYQVSDTIKASVPEHVKSAAREIAQKAWKERLESIRMSELDYDLYMRYYKRVELQIVAIRAILDTLQATSKERQWIRHKTHGDLDDGKLVEGVLGEKSIYRARGEKDPEPGSPQTKPKRLRVICDLSGSMYRFNGYDKRLERQMEAILMLMESFVNIKSDKIVYDIFAHSGEGPQFPFVKLKKPPVNEKERMDVLSAMLAHSQFCLSGDNTLEAIDAGINDLKKTVDSVDQSFLIVLSDANLSRYGIPASSVAKLLLKDKEIKAFIVFIGSLGDQAQLLKKALPIGHSFVCMDIETLPQILRNIFTANLL